DGDRRADRVRGHHESGYVSKAAGAAAWPSRVLAERPDVRVANPARDRRQYPSGDTQPVVPRSVELASRIMERIVNRVLRDQQRRYGDSVLVRCGDDDGSTTECDQQRKRRPHAWVLRRAAFQRERSESDL